MDKHNIPGMLRLNMNRRYNKTGMRNVSELQNQVNAIEVVVFTLSHELSKLAWLPRLLSLLLDIEIISCSLIFTVIRTFVIIIRHYILSTSDHATDEEVMRRAGMERLQDIVTIRRRKMAGNILRLQRERPAHTAMHQKAAEEREWSQRRHGEVLSKKNQEEMGVSWHEARSITSDRERWRILVARCPMRNRRN